MDNYSIPVQVVGVEETYASSQDKRRTMSNGTGRRKHDLSRVDPEHELLKIAKDKAREATQQNATQQAQEPGIRSTTLRVTGAMRAAAKSLL
jgi:hypothetical protein